MLTIGTRGSALALWQANYIADRLREAHPGLEVTLEIITTSGDRIQNRALYEVGGKGLFVKEIEEALYEKRIDLAVHSMKDVPGILPEGLELAAMPSRENPYDAFLSDKYKSVEDLPQGARVGTTSLRRRFQLLQIRPDLEILPIRGNVGTRIDKMRNPENNLAGTLLAVSGLRRLGMEDVITEVLDAPRFLPAIGQGALGIEIRSDDDKTRALLEPLRDVHTETCVKAERGVLAQLEGDCRLPLAAHASIDGETLSVTARLGVPDASEVLERSISGDLSDPETLGRKLGQEILDNGGVELMQRIDEMVDQAANKGVL